MFCPECRAEYRPGFTHCNDCDVDLVYDLPPWDARARRPKRDTETYPTNNAPKLLSALIKLGWIPAGLLCLSIGERLPRIVQIPFGVLLCVAIIYYRLAGGRKLGRKWDQWSKHW